MLTYMKSGYFYMMTNQRKTVLYAGVTAYLVLRVAEHIAGFGGAFTKRNRCDRLIYFECYDDIAQAIVREKQVKNRRRAWKNDLVQATNPMWEDLSHSIGVTPEVVTFVIETRKRDQPMLS